MLALAGDQATQSVVETLEMVHLHPQHTQRDSVFSLLECTFECTGTVIQSLSTLPCVQDQKCYHPAA